MADNSFRGMATHNFKVFGTIMCKLLKPAKQYHRPHNGWYKNIVSWSVYCPSKHFSWKQADPLAFHLHTANMLLKILSIMVPACIILSDSAAVATCTSGQMDNWYAQPSRIPNNK
jgi:hypothetical protein